MVRTLLNTLISPLMTVWADYTQPVLQSTQFFPPPKNFPPRNDNSMQEWFCCVLFLSCSATIWAFFGLGLLVSVILIIMACIKWPFYACLTYPLWECLGIFWNQFKRFFSLLRRMFKTMLFYASLVVTTIVYTFACCICFIVMQEWPWVMAYKHVSEKFGRQTLRQGCCCGEGAIIPEWHLKNAEFVIV